MPNIKWEQLNKIQRTEDKIIDQSVETFTKRVEKLYRDAENRFRRMILDYAEARNIKEIDFEFALVNKANIEQVLQQTGYYDFIEDYISDQQDLINEIVKEYNLFDHKVEFTRLSESIINQLQQNAIDLLDEGGTRFQQEIYNAIFDTLVTDKPLDTVLGLLPQIVEDTKLLSYAGTTANTQYMTFSRTVTETINRETGWNNRIYTGPVDLKIRPFCIKYVGKILTVQEIEKLDNGQLPNSLVTGGGYNCRHKWMAVPPGYELSNKNHIRIEAQKARVEIIREEEEEKKAA